MSKFHDIVGIICLLSLGVISNVNGDCDNTDGSSCTGTACCYDGINGIPPILGDPGVIAPDQSCYDSGTAVAFSCVDGDLKGPPFNDCTNGAWGFPFGPTCEAVTSCVQPQVPTYGTITPDETESDLYTRIYYACNAGYSLVGPSEAVCESQGVWNPATTPTCEASCTKPTLTNGGVVPDQANFNNGQVLTYECDTNYTLVGVSTTTCRNGAFDPVSLPTCYGMCNPPVVDNSDYSTQQPPVDHASTITINCNSGYSTGTGTDQDLTCTSGNFDGEPPVCYANCPPLSSSFDNGDRSGDTTPFYHNEMVSYTCNNGYTLEGSPSITCSDGGWTDTEPVCKANCAVGAVPNSDYSSASMVTHNTTFFITCNSGYSTGTAMASELSCDGGTLSPDTLPTCYADCTPPVVFYSNYLSEQDDVFHTTNITITCWANYSTGPDSQSTVLQCDDGTFQGDSPTCYENCAEISDPDNGEITSGDSPFFHLETVTFQCFDNFTLIGQTEITCGDGLYDNDPPVCSAKCKPPVIPYSDATSSSPLLESGESITVTCESGYSNGQSQDTTSTCTNGLLEPAIPLCYADCTPPVVDDSDYDIQQDDVYHSTPITITCNTGYSTGTRLDTTLTCVEGSFNGTMPTCYADCTPPVVSYSDYRTQQDDVLHSSEFTVTCWSNYSTGPDSQETTVSCDNGTLSEESVVCFENCVVPVVEDSDYSEQKEVVFHFVTFNITCDDGYSNSQDIYTSLTCNDGVLSDEDPTCYANCPDFGSIKDGSYTGDAPPFYHEETVTFGCDTNHTLVGDDTITCNDGNWSASIPSCKADCLPPVIPNSDYNTSQSLVTHDTVLLITCDTGYSTGLDVTQSVTCDDGSFSPVPLDCLRDCTPPIVNNSDYATQQDSVFTFESFVITCNANYTAGDGDSTTTTTVTCGDGQLDEEDVTCYANCPDPGEPADAQYVYEGDGFYHGTVVYYYCNDRFDLIGESELICEDGEWSSAAPNCTDTSIYDLIMLTCGPTGMEVEIPVILLNGIANIDIGMEGDLTCNGYIDGDLMRVNTSLSGCGTNITENSTHDTYTNRVVNNYLNDVITRVVDVQIPLTCSYPRNQQVRAVRYAVLDYVLGKNLEETGTYKTTFGIYNTTCFTNRYADGGAIDLDINDELFFQLELVTDVADNILVAQDCWATPSEYDQDTTNHDLVVDGCPSDETLTFISDNGVGTTVKFKLKSFRFIDDADKEVYVHCEVFVCHEDSTVSFCIADCASSRSRRRTYNQISAWERAKLKGQMLNKTLLDAGEERMKRASGHHDPVVKYVKAGPFHWNVDVGAMPQVPANGLANTGEESNIQAHSNGGQTSESASSAWMHSVIGMGAIIVVFSLVLMVVVKHYRRRLRKDYRYQSLNRCG